MTKTSRSNPVTSARAPRCARAFTLIEISVVLIIIILLAGLVIVAASRAMRGARLTAERQMLVAMKQAITNFKNEFGFLPPLVDDANPVSSNPFYNNTYQVNAIGGSRDPAVQAQQVAFLQGRNPGGGILSPDTRYSELSLTYYLMGACNFEATVPSGKPVDGAAGSRFTAPRSDGTFSQRGKAYDSTFDVSSHPRRLAGATSADFRVTFNDRWGRPIRYYRWDPRPADPTVAGSKVTTLVPRAAGDPRTNEKVRGARYALVILGEDGATDNGAPIEVASGNEPPVGGAAADDIVEVDE